MAARSASFAAALVLTAWLGLSAAAWADFKDGERAFDVGDYAAAMVEWRPLAENGDVRAQVNLGHLYRLGQGVERDYGAALKWYRHAADQGSTRAQANLGNMYIEGQGVEADPIAGVALFRQAAESGFAVAQLYLGDFYRLGEVVVLDPEQAALWYRRAADQGHPEAALRLGRMYLVGTGVAIDEARAARSLREAAVFGLAAAQYELAELYRRGRGVERDLKEAMRWYHAAAGQGHVSAVERLAASGGGELAGDPNHQLRVAAEVGDPAAQMRLATLLREGNEMPRNAAAALEWYRRAAAQGHPRASYNLGLMYRDGDGVEADDIMAAAWFRRAAGFGEADAQYTLGVFLSKGIGGATDPAAARDWFLRAARQGDSRAQYSLGVMHEKGAGGAVDIAAAMKWYSAAAKQGDLRAHERFAALTVETAVSTAPPADLDPLDGQTEEALTASSAAGLDALERVDEAAGMPSDGEEPAGGLASAEPEDSATLEAASETVVEAPPEPTMPEATMPEAEAVSVTVTTGTGIVTRVESQENREAVEPEASIFEFNWFGGGDDSEAEEAETPPEEPEAETATTRTAVARQVERPNNDESVPSEAPVIEFDWFGGEEESKTGQVPPEEAESPPEESEETVAVQEVEDSDSETSMTTELAPDTPEKDTVAVRSAIATDRDEAVGSEAPVIEGNWFQTTAEPEETVEEAAPSEQAISALEAEIPDNSPENPPADTADESPAGNPETDDETSAEPVTYWRSINERGAESPFESVEYDLFLLNVGRSSPSDGDSISAR